MGLEIGVLSVRRCILILAPPERIWEEFETADRFAAWYGTGHTLELYQPRLGGDIQMSVDIDGVHSRFGGKITVFDPGIELSFDNNWFSNNAWPVPTFITLRLRQHYDGTMVELFHHGFERLGADAADQLQNYEAGWDVHHLAALRAIVEGSSA
jgi:uncharacterized protein YndB with AHSA1/START domain